MNYLTNVSQGVKRTVMNVMTILFVQVARMDLLEAKATQQFANLLVSNYIKKSSITPFLSVLHGP